MEIERERHLKRGIGAHASKIYVPVTVKAKGVRPTACSPKHTHGDTPLRSICLRTLWLLKKTPQALADFVAHAPKYGESYCIVPFGRRWVSVCYCPRPLPYFAKRDG
jgi:hypothetical protein